MANCWVKKVQAASAPFSQINVNLTVWTGDRFAEIHVYMYHSVAYNNDSVTFHLTDWIKFIL